MEESGASQGQSASELISKRIAELGDWRGETLSRMRKLGAASRSAGMVWVLHRMDAELSAEPMPDRRSAAHHDGEVTW